MAKPLSNHRPEDRGVTDGDLKAWLNVGKLMSWSGVKQLTFRKVKNFKSGANVLVMASGSIRAQQRYPIISNLYSSNTSEMLGYAA